MKNLFFDEPPKQPRQRRLSVSDADERLRKPISLQREYGKLLESADKLSISSPRGPQLTVGDFQQLAAEQDGRKQRRGVEHQQQRQQELRKFKDHGFPETSSGYSARSRQIRRETRDYREAIPEHEVMNQSLFQKATHDLHDPER